jgi:16S rRNA processing protein RimM
MIDKSESVKIGLIAKPHGIGGEVVARALTGFTSEDLCYEFLFVELDGGLVPFYVEEVRVKNGEEVLVKFEYVDSQEEARRISGSDVYVSREWLEEQGEELSVGGFVGYKACESEAGELGTIIDIDDQNGVNPLFVIERNGTEILVPMVDSFISAVDVNNRIVTFELPEGLLDL